jgi:Tfp pilus assembly protein PilE
MNVKHQAGFTVIELIIFFVIMAVLAGFFILQKTDLQSSYDDQTRKTAINAMAYDLVEVYRPAQGYYPSSITADDFTVVPPELLFDPWGIEIGEIDSDYRYEGLDCNNEGKCQKFKLIAELEKEAEYIVTQDDI